MPWKFNEVQYFSLTTPTWAIIEVSYVVWRHSAFVSGKYYYLCCQHKVHLKLNLSLHYFISIEPSHQWKYYIKKNCFKFHVLFVNELVRRCLLFCACTTCRSFNNTLIFVLPTTLLIKTTFFQVYLYPITTSCSYNI